MTPDQIRRVQETFEKIAPSGDRFSERFYEILFRNAPETRVLFRGDSREQQRKFLTTLIFIVRNLQYAERILATVEDLGRRHIGYGVKPEHYAVVGTALLDTLAEALDSSFDDSTRAAWTSAYQLLAEAMQRSAACGTSAPASAPLSSREPHQ